MIRRQQITAARGLLSWSKVELASRCGVSERTISRFESGEADITVSKLDRIETCMLAEGVVFIDGGVVLERLKRGAPTHTA